MHTESGEVMEAIEYIDSLIAGQKMGSSLPVQVSELEMLKTFLEIEQTIAKGRAALAALANAEPTGCLWSKDPDFEMGDTYDSSCGEKWSFIDGGPSENRVSFCQGCGKPVKLAKEQL